MFSLILATIIGYVLGQERKRHDKSGGGSRTLAIIALASCLIAVITLEIANKIHPEVHNFTRLISYSVVGIGFLGSAVITKTKDGVDGLTTAGLIWAIVPISFCIGLRFYFYGIISSILLYLILESKYWMNRGEN